LFPKAKVTEKEKKAVRLYTLLLLYIDPFVVMILFIYLDAKKKEKPGDKAAMQ
jgi:hypothetical protein